MACKMGVGSWGRSLSALVWCIQNRGCKCKIGRAWSRNVIGLRDPIPCKLSKLMKGVSNSHFILHVSNSTLSRILKSPLTGGGSAALEEAELVQSEQEQH